MTRYRARDSRIREILDRPRWQEWIEFECEAINRLAVKDPGRRADWSLADFKPEALEWDYYHDAVLRGGHEVAELVSRMAEVLPLEYHRYLHRGFTSSNVIDSCNHRRWNRLALRHHEAATETLHAFRLASGGEAEVPGLTHGRFAHVTTVRHRMESGFPGFFHQPGLPELVTGGPTGYPDSGHRQAYPRSAYWPLWTHLARTSAWLEQVATDYRFYCSDLGVGYLGVTGELNDAAVGSSSMPGKRNPTAFERVCSVGHLIRTTTCTQLTLPPQWLDRDLVHSATERETLDRLWDWSFWQLEEMALLADEVGLTVDPMPTPPINSYEEMQRRQGQGEEWHAARKASATYPTG